jgi:hypothetical protein
MRCYGKKFTPHVPCMPYHCHCEIFVRFSRKFSRKQKMLRTKYRENRPILACFSHFRENWKMSFRSTLGKTFLRHFTCIMYDSLPMEEFLLNCCFKTCGTPPNVDWLHAMQFWLSCMLHSAYTNIVWLTKWRICFTIIQRCFSWGIFVTQEIEKRICHFEIKMWQISLTWSITGWFWSVFDI